MGSIGISVDHRRRSVSEVNKARLESYKSKLVIIKKDTAAVPAQLPKGTLMSACGQTKAYKPEKARSITAEQREFSAYTARREERNVKRYAGIRAKRAADKAAKGDTGKK